MRSFEVLSQYLSELHSRGNNKNGIHFMQQLAIKYKHPEKCYPTIHIAGTNGKGSVSLKIAKALQYSGYKVGVYTSPHLHSVRERIMINDEYIPRDYFCKKVEEYLALDKKTEEKITFFEIMTLLAFEFFRDEKVDVAIIEAGVGGKDDFTNIIDPCLSVITSISWDHAEVLGDSLEKIAEQKAGIIKSHTPIVIGPHIEFPCIFKKARECNAPLIAAQEKSPFYDIENTALARLSLEQIADKFNLTKEGIEKGVSMRPSCRFEKIGTVIFDVAHNEDGLSKLFQAVESHFPEQEFHVLIGMARDKEIKKCLQLIASKAKKIHLIQLPSPRTASLEDLAKSLKDCHFYNFATYSSIKEGMEKAQKETGLLIVCGSFYLMDQAKAALL